MSSVAEHYSRLLAPVYVWMHGGIEAALESGQHDIEPLLPGDGLAIDLGAGFGIHSVPLARGGYRVVAIDQSAALLKTLAENAAGLPIRTVETDLLEFARVVDERARLIICMGDTLTHLETTDHVDLLCEAVSRALAVGGTFVASFRDYCSPAAGDQRFIPVRSDADRILTCFLEASDAHMTVHDLLHERHADGWHFTVSSYRKLRLAPERVEHALSARGLKVRVEPAPRGMVRIVAVR